MRRILSVEIKNREGREIIGIVTHLGLLLQVETFYAFYDCDHWWVEEGEINPVIVPHLEKWLDNHLTGYPNTIV